MGLQSRTSSTY